MEFVLVRLRDEFAAIRFWLIRMLWFLYFRVGFITGPVRGVPGRVADSTVRR